MKRQIISISMDLGVDALIIYFKMHTDKRCVNFNRTCFFIRKQERDTKGICEAQNKRAATEEKTWQLTVQRQEQECVENADSCASDERTRDGRAISLYLSFVPRSYLHVQFRANLPVG